MVFFFCRSSAATVGVSGPADSVIVKSSHFAYSPLTYHPGPTHTHYRVIIIEAGLVDSSSSCYVVLGCEVLGVGDSDDTGMRGLCMCPCGAPVDPSFLLCRQPLLLKELKHSSYGFFMSFLPPSERAFNPSWRRRRGFPGEFYKCPSGGTAGTSLFPSARKLSSERRQSSAWWESWRSFWSALGCDSRCWSGMRQKDRNEEIWANVRADTFPILYSCQSATCIFIFNMTWQNKEI